MGGSEFSASSVSAQIPHLGVPFLSHQRLPLVPWLSNCSLQQDHLEDLVILGYWASPPEVWFIRLLVELRICISNKSAANTVAAGVRTTLWNCLSLRDAWVWIFTCWLQFCSLDNQVSGLGPSYVSLGLQETQDSFRAALQAADFPLLVSVGHSWPSLSPFSLHSLLFH